MEPSDFGPFGMLKGRLIWDPPLLHRILALLLVPFSLFLAGSREEDRRETRVGGIGGMRGSEGATPT